jgi:ankyrin repeat protein
MKSVQQIAFIALPFFILAACDKPNRESGPPTVNRATKENRAGAAQLIPEEAIKKDDVQTVSKAIREGADVNGFYGAGASLTALMKAADSDSAAVAKLLIEKKADVNRSDRGGSTALMHAARQNASKVAALLLEQKADVEASDKAGLTALMFASEASSYEVAKLLIDHGAKINGTRDSYGMTPLIRAIKGRSVSVAQLLVDKGADVNAGLESSDKYAGATPLMYAAGSASLPIVKLLVERGADVKARDKANNSVLSVAEKAELNDEVIAFLKEHGAL